MTQWKQPLTRGQAPIGPAVHDMQEEVSDADSGPYIPERFARRVSSHLLANIGEVPGTPLILGVHGAPGTGKTYQIEVLLQRMNFELFAISGGQLESQHAGEPAMLIRSTYENASDVLKTRAAACLVFNDIDTGGGEWEGNTGTVNHQTVLGELMHLVDFPTRVGERVTKRVPIIMTGNDMTKLYEPLRRPGRMRLFEWSPNMHERIMIIARIFASRPEEVVRALATRHELLPLSFYSDLNSALIEKVLDVGYPTLQNKAQAIHELLQTRRVLAVSADAVSNDEVLETADELARSFSISSHLGPPND